MKTILKTLLIVTLPLLAVPTAHARKYECNGYVVHTRLAPVVVHKISPPYLGKHIYRPDHGHMR